MNQPVNLIDQSADDANLHVRNAVSFVNRSTVFEQYLKSVRLQYLQNASNTACMGGEEKAIECLHKADAVALIYEQMFGVPQ